MRHAHYELMENGRFYGSIPECTGCWAEGATLEECRDELQSTLEDWLLLGLQMGHSLPVIGAFDLNHWAWGLRDPRTLGRWDPGSLSP